MSKIERLNTRVSKLLSLAVQEVLEVVRETVWEYQEKSARTQRENQSLKRRLQELQDKINADCNGILPQVPSAPEQAETKLSPTDQKSRQRDMEEEVDEHSADIYPSNSYEAIPDEAPITVQHLMNSCFSLKDTTELCLGDENFPCLRDIKIEAESAPSRPITSKGNSIFTVSDNESHPQSHHPFTTEGIKAEPQLEEEEALQVTNYFHDVAGTSTFNLEPKVNSAPYFGSGVILNQNDSEEPLTSLSDRNNMNSVGTGNKKSSGGAGLRTFQRRTRKRYSCSLCGRTFTHAGDFKKHNRVHTGEKPYCCPVCGKRFSQSGSLTVHLRFHSGEKPFGCHQCGRGFYRAVDLKKHLRTHQ